jgi:hypothetical protein
MKTINLSKVIRCSYKACTLEPYKKTGLYFPKGFFGVYPSKVTGDLVNLAQFSYSFVEWYKQESNLSVVRSNEKCGIRSSLISVIMCDRILLFGDSSDDPAMTSSTISSKGSK